VKVTFASGPDTTVRVTNMVNNEVFEFFFDRQPLSVQFDPGNDIVIKQGSTTVGSTLVAPTLVSPEHGGIVPASGLAMVWRDVPSAVTYRLQIWEDSTSATMVVDDSTITDSSAVVNVPPGAEYLWRVNARNGGGTGSWSAIRSFVATGTGALISLQNGWNMVSVPVETGGATVPALFPGATSWYRYEPGVGYAAFDSMEAGTGYWIRVDAAQSVLVPGTPAVVESIAVVAGWNLIGGPVTARPVAGITSSPPGIVSSSFYRFTDQYVTASSLEPGRSYWVQANATGWILLPPGQTRKIGTQIPQKE